MHHESTESTSTDFSLVRWGEALRRGWPPPEEIEAADLSPASRAGTEPQAEIDREMARLGVPAVGVGEPDTGSGGHLGVSHPALGPAPGGEPVPGYRLVGRLGAGASGEVWKAIGPGGIPVALKFIHLGEEAGDRTERSALRARRDGLRSLELMREVRHANLLTLFGAWYAHGRLVIGMELADGTLMDRADEATEQGLPGIPLPELIDSLRQAARGIDFLNEPRHALSPGERLGIQHRDIKPQNLLRVGGGVKVGDFGQAKLVEDAILNTGCLTPAYAAPEFFQGQSSNRSDQYSLAVTYCRLRGGRLPFTGNRWEVMLGHCQGEPDLSMLPEAERPPIARSLSKDPSLRWPDCASLVDALTSAALAEPSTIAAETAPRLLVDPRPESSPPRRRWAAALLVLAAVLGGLASLRVADRAPEPSSPSPVAVLESTPLTTVEVPETPRHPREFRPPVAQPRPWSSEPSLTLPNELASAATPHVDEPGDPSTSEPARWNEGVRALVLREQQGRTVTRLAEVVPAAWTPPPPPPAPSPSRTATIQVLMPIEKAVLYIPKDKVHLVGLGNPDDWYGPRRMVHTKPIVEGVDFEVGAFWTDARGRQLSRLSTGRVLPGGIYQVDLRTSQPAWSELDHPTNPTSQVPGDRSR